VAEVAERPKRRNNSTHQAKGGSTTSQVLSGVRATTVGLTDAGSPNFAYRPALNRNKLVHICHADDAVCEQLAVLFRFEGFESSRSHRVSHLVDDLERRNPSFVLMPLIGLPHTWTALEALKKRHLGVRVVGLTDGQDMELAVMAMKAGTYDVVSVPVEPERLMRSVIAAIREDAKGGRGSKPVTPRGFTALTRRERDVLALLVNGFSNKDMATKLGISYRTVEVHRASLMGKLGARNAADLVRKTLSL